MKKLFFHVQSVGIKEMHNQYRRYFVSLFIDALLQHIVHETNKYDS